MATTSQDGDKFLAKPSGVCCLKSVIEQGEPQGSITNVSDIDTYISRPTVEKANGNIVIYFPDIFGLSKTGRLIMDSFAAAGYLTLGLDYFRGDPVSKHLDDKNEFLPEFDFEAWKAIHLEFAEDNVPKWLNEVKEQYGEPGTKYACVGYCFGAPYVCDGLAGDMFTAGAFAHPAFLKEHHFESVKKPLFLSCAGQDAAFDTSSRRRAIDILQTEGKLYHVQLFSGVEHGFALRGDAMKPYERYAKHQSLLGIINWFDIWLSQEA